MNQKPLVMYHGNCWDGFCAAWVARTALGAIEAVPVQYGQPAPSVTDREVYLLDFCYSAEVLAAMADASASLVVLDHHKTAAAALDAVSISSVFDINKSGGRITWEYFAGIGGWLGMPAPWLVEYTEDRDLWRHTLPNSEEVNAALRSYPLDFDLWDREFAGVGPPPLRLVAEGAAIRRCERQIVDSHVRNARLENFDGTHTVPIVNATVLFSEIAGALAEGHPFGACYFDRQDGKRQWSLRSTTAGVDVSEIAKQHGGGGHQHAAGFEESLP